MNYMDFTMRQNGEGLKRLCVVLNATNYIYICK